MFYFCSMEAEARQLDDLRQVAYRLGMAFGQAAEIEGDFDRKLQLFDAFHRGFASVRLSIALAMRWAREGRLPARTIAEPTEREGERLEVLERPDYPERPDFEVRPERYTERDRDREAERASLPLLLRTLDSVADDAQALLPAVADLPTLRELLDQIRGPSAVPAATSGSAPTAIQAGKPSSGRSPSPLRARLTGGTATLARPPSLGLDLPGLPQALQRRSTGPP
jgi:hypothetical protein